MDSRTAEHPRPNHFLLHLSDTHLVAGDGALYGDVDSAARLSAIVADIEASGTHPEAIVVTGDVADKGEAGAYVRIRDIVEPAARRIGAQVIWAMGNHDERGAFRQELFGLQPTDRPVDFVYDVNGLRVITLDTSVPGAHHGEVSPAQLDWLAEVLSEAAPHGTILAMHHPPVPSVQDLAVLVELRDQAALAEVIEGSDVISIIAGHLHYSTSAVFAGVPVSVASATCYTQDLTEYQGGTGGRTARSRSTSSTCTGTTSCTRWCRSATTPRSGSRCRRSRRRHVSRRPASPSPRRRAGARHLEHPGVHPRHGAHLPRPPLTAVRPRRLSVLTVVRR